MGTKEINKSRKETILEDYTKDVRAYMQNLKGVVISLCVVLLICVITIAVIVVHNQKMMKELADHSADKIVEILSGYEWQTEYEIVSTNNELYYGDINIGR